MNKRNYPFSFFLIGFLSNFFLRYALLLMSGVILLILGIRFESCTYIGVILIVADLLLSFLEQMRIRRTMLSDSDDPGFREFQDAISKDGNVLANIKDFVNNAIEKDDSFYSEKEDLVFKTFEAICDKFGYGDDLGKLNEHEKVIYVALMLGMEVNNGGFAQFFFNSSGELSSEVVDAFIKIGAFKTAEICKKALAVFGGNVPTDRAEREDLLISLDCDDVLGECDDEFYKDEDNLLELYYIYITEHRSFFE